ncbi:MAG: DUF4954 family protein [Saprospiraceae bacterium]|nr:DUF4954 family protein [Saprospiraceae bacterium]MCB9318588.1 DUF4954 family protein [Lewinellaceae bacterium]
MGGIQKKPIDHIGYDFLAGGALRKVEDDARRRDKQKSWPYAFRPLEPAEIEVLVHQENTASDWRHIWVADGFNPRLVRNSRFFGLVRIGPLHPVYLEFHDLSLPVGIYNSTIISCDVGEDVAIMNVRYLAHYLIDPDVILLNIDEMHVTDHAKFGEGVLKEGEPESIRVWLEVMNENGRRKILPFAGMRPFDAWMWTRYRGDLLLQARFKEWTQALSGDRFDGYGEVGSNTVIKSCRILKDVRIGSYAYIKGANKLKNLTILSEEARPSQIGEGVEMVNGIMGYGCRAFYGVKAIRFLMDDHTTLKYGARLINSYLGANSTISCCEVLNSLIFPFHEQHHNNSFLIAGLIEGQSNIASGATLGSNHNTRQADGEFTAKRGFWPGLCVNIKHNSVFASYTLLVKGDYAYELNNPLPFALLSNDTSKDELTILPAYWWIYNAYALFRNEMKHQTREQRKNRPANAIRSFLAADTAQEILQALEFLSRYQPGDDGMAEIDTGVIENSKRRVMIVKFEEAMNAYREMLLFYAARCMAEQAGEIELDTSFDNTLKWNDHHWVNAGGLLFHQQQLELLIDGIHKHEMVSWEDFHDVTDRFATEYPQANFLTAIGVLNKLGYQNLESVWHDQIQLLSKVRHRIHESRLKDYQNEFRKATSETEAEWNAVYGDLESEEQYQSILRFIETEIQRFSQLSLISH